MANILTTEFFRFYKEYLSDDQLRVIERMDIDQDQRLQFKALNKLFDICGGPNS